MNRDLFLAILSMDSYNRGYGEGISNLPVVLNSTKIGNAKIVRQSDVLPGSDGVASGFYAIAYDMTGVAGFAAGERVISFRGSDNIDKSEAFSNFILGGIFGSPTAEDITNGFGVAFGVPNGPQATLAIEFYRAVAGSSGHAQSLNLANITLTLHSLGSGLPGLVSAANDNLLPLAIRAAA